MIVVMSLAEFEDPLPSAGRNGDEIGRLIAIAR